MCISRDTPSRVLLLVWSVDTLALRAEIQAPDEVSYTSSVLCAGLSLYLLSPSPVSLNRKNTIVLRPCHEIRSVTKKASVIVDKSRRQSKLAFVDKKGKTMKVSGLHYTKVTARRSIRLSGMSSSFFSEDEKATHGTESERWVHDDV